MGKFAHGRYDDDGDDGDGVRVSSHYAQTNYVGSGVKNGETMINDVSIR